MNLLWKLNRCKNILFNNRKQKDVLISYLRDRILQGKYDCVWLKLLLLTIYGFATENEAYVKNTEYTHRMDAINDLMQYLNMEDSKYTFYNSNLDKRKTIVI